LTKSASAETQRRSVRLIPAGDTLEHACRAYARGEVNLSQAARHADVSVEEMMRELEQRGIDYGPTTEQFLDRLETLAVEFDAPGLGQVAAELREHQELWEVSKRP